VETLLYVLGIIAVMIGLALSIGLHELGHLWPAKLFGVRVTRYMIGFGPTVFSKTKGETEYGLKAIPLGGFITMVGMYPPERKPYSGPFKNWITEARAEVRKELLESDEGRQFHQLKPWKKNVIMLGGPLMNLFLGALLLVTAMAGIGPMQPSLTVNQVFDCVEGETCSTSGVSPAKTAGMLAGDRVVSVNGVEVTSWEQAVEQLRTRTEQASEIVVMRGEELRSLSVKPIFTERQLFDAQGQVLKDANGLPVTELRPIVGIQLQSKNTPLSMGEALGYAGQTVTGTLAFIFDLPQQLYSVTAATLGFQERDQAGVVSIVGIGQLAGEVSASDGLGIESKIATLLLLLGSLNIALFAFNLIPLLPLDGGHVLAGLYESFKRLGARLIGRKEGVHVDTAAALPLAYAVWVLLIAVGMLVIIADLTNPISF
jgi:membrane-associated protease RseP (regulator of RpoE activity)